MSAKHLVFLLHGMGEHKDGWSVAELQQPLDKAASQYSYFKNQKDAAGQRIPVSNLLEFREINYGAIFSDALANWSDSANKILGTAGADTLTLQAALGFLAGAKDDKFVWTHVADVVLWYTLPFIRNLVMATVAETLARDIDRQINATGAEKRYSLIAHSLGTSVAHETVAALVTGQYSSSNGYSGDKIKFHSFHTLANVSRILKWRQSYDEPPVVRPDKVTGPGCCWYFFNYRNLFDPFTFLQTFMADWGPRAPMIEISHVSGINTHAIEHYLDNPDVHVPMLRALFNADAVTIHEETDSRAEFDARTPIDSIEDLKTRLQQIKDIFSESPNPVKLVKGLIKMWKEMKGQVEED